MNPIRSLREHSGQTQTELAEQTGLSLRTIQRAENNQKAPKGHTLKVLAESFQLKPQELQVQFEQDPNVTSKDTHLQFINLSCLGFFIFPFGNLILSYHFWKKYKSDPRADKVGRHILNWQIIWTLTLVIVMSFAPFIGKFFDFSFPLILYALVVFLVIQVIFVIRNAIHIKKGQLDQIGMSYPFL